MKAIAVSIVEDLDDIRRSLERILGASEAICLLSSYSNGENALTGLPEEQPDVVIMDINLPGISGVECIKKLREKCPRAQFMMFTIYEDTEQVFEALSAGASGYLLKKTPPDRIIDAIVELHGGGAPMTAAIARRVVGSFQKHSATDEKSKLSGRENEVLHLLSKGLLYKEIAMKLNISFGTVRQHIHNIYEKLHVQNKTEAINKVYRQPGN